MNREQIIRAWKDVSYRMSLPKHNVEAHRHPAGAIELGDAELGQVAGGGIIVKPGPGPKPSSYDYSCTRPATICPNTPRLCYPGPLPF